MSASIVESRRVAQKVTTAAFSSACPRRRFAAPGSDTEASGGPPAEHAGPAEGEHRRGPAVCWHTGARL
jgi:hypothetical protein